MVQYYNLEEALVYIPIQRRTETPAKPKFSMYDIFDVVAVFSSGQFEIEEKGNVTKINMFDF